MIFWTNGFLYNPPALLAKIRLESLISSISGIPILFCQINTHTQGEEGMPQFYNGRATLSSFSRPSHLEILVFPILYYKDTKFSQTILDLWKQCSTIKHLYQWEGQEFLGGSDEKLRRTWAIFEVGLPPLHTHTRTNSYNGLRANF